MRYLLIPLLQSGNYRLRTVQVAVLTALNMPAVEPLVAMELSNKMLSSAAPPVQARAAECIMSVSSSMHATADLQGYNEEPIETDSFESDSTSPQNIELNPVTSQDVAQGAAISQKEVHMNHQQNI